MVETARQPPHVEASTGSPHAKESTRATAKIQAKPATLAAASPREKAAKSSHRDYDSDATPDDMEDQEDDSEEPGAGPERAERIFLASAANTRRPVAFQPSHALKFGLEIVARDAQTGAVSAALCLFCKFFGREPRPGAKRRATTNFKYFKGVFRTDQYLQHLRLQHPLKWTEYDAASVQQKQVFFPRHVMTLEIEADAEMESLVSRGRAASVKKQKLTGGSGRGDVEYGEGKATDTSDQKLPASLELALPLPIIKLFQGDSPLKLRSVSTGDLSIQRGADSVTEPSAGEADRAYHVTIADRLAFDVAVDLCASGLSAGQITSSMHAMAKYVPHSAGLVSVWEELVGNYVEVATLGSFAIISKLMAESWAFSVGIQRLGKSDDYVGVRVRFAAKKLVDLHLCRLPAAGLQESLPQLLDVMYPNWTKSLVGVSVDGDVSASDSVLSTIQALQRRTTMGESLRLIWNGNALLAYAFRSLFVHLMDGAFAATFHRLKTYVKFESALIQEIGHEYQAGMLPSTAGDDDSLENIVMATRWLSEKRVRIRKYLDEDAENRDQHPSPSWWLCLAVFDSIAGSAFQLNERLRPSSSTAKATTARVASVIEHTSFISAAFKVESALEVATAASVIQYNSANSAFATTKTSMLEFVVDLGSFVNGLLASLRDDTLEELVKSLGVTISTYVETLATGLDHARKLSSQEATGASVHVGELSVFPQELAKLAGKEFDAVLDQYRELLLQRYSDEELDLIEQEHQALKRATREKEFPSWAVDSRDCIAQFDVTWARTLGRFRMLHAFVAGLATVLPRDNVSLQAHVPSVDSPDSSGSVLNLRVEAPLHAAQFHLLQESLARETSNTDRPSVLQVRHTGTDNTSVSAVI